MPNEVKSLVHELIGLGIFNIITEIELIGLKKEIQMYLLEDMIEEYIKDKFSLVHGVKENTVFNFKGRKITIGIVGDNIELVLRQWQYSLIVKHLTMIMVYLKALIIKGIKVYYVSLK